MEQKNKIRPKNYLPSYHLELFLVCPAVLAKHWPGTFSVPINHKRLLALCKLVRAVDKDLHTWPTEFSRALRGDSRNTQVNVLSQHYHGDVEA